MAVLSSDLKEFPPALPIARAHSLEQRASGSALPKPLGGCGGVAQEIAVATVFLG
jgi:hypothetical protein